MSVDMRVEQYAVSREEVSVVSGGVEPETLGVIFYVIGDKFRDFSDTNIILTYSDAIEHLKLIAQIAKCIVVGQGVSRGEVRHLDEMLQRVCTVRVIEILHKTDQKIYQQLVDKLDEKNVLITFPKSINAREFHSSLVVDDDCAEMADCHNAEHIQGILLVEAAKQMFIACVRTHDVAPEFPSAIDQDRKSVV